MGLLNSDEYRLAMRNCAKHWRRRFAQSEAGLLWCAVEAKKHLASAIWYRNAMHREKKLNH